MATVFTDEAGPNDLTITTSADWTVSSGGMPNGDNYVTGDGSIAATYTTAGDDYSLHDGTEWTIEFWWYPSSNVTAAQVIADCCKQTVVNIRDINWRLVWQDTEAWTLALFNTADGTYLSATTPSYTSNTNIWYYVVFIKEAGNTIRYYVRRTDTGSIASGSSSSTSGTVTSNTGTWLYLGTASSGANDLTAVNRLAKLAIYNRALSEAERNQHYLAMVAS